MTLLIPDAHTFINFRNGTYQWVDVQHFRRAQSPAAGHDRELLAALTGHSLFGHDYGGGEAGDDPDRHGPYWRARITPDSYEQAAPEAAEQLLRSWAEQHAPVSRAIRSDLETHLHATLRAAETLYRLRGLGREAFHDWGGVHVEFHEFVALTPTHLTLIVAADD
ncbi:hypothetical protein GCM10010168_36440 [Actinoplanes ianthinogenes]|uniref:Uncharacterized protein n=1 Tax=Actinoplanes ianthinogenes TaxID=122358 RepID=A0ABM7M5G2_9ACTN|nr:hypothetical protein [Actinoplanes ianthinogenes]BCJ46834.1 hypothetical protein Aiant_74910 [Actinoplanes ianthinogenes]GGR15197.1 hypothetical protein GCM10010168_36440 [Actinoplanes ianthinogenes]